MPKIEMNHAHSLEAAEVKSRMEAVQADLATRYGLKFDWKSETELEVSGKGVKGTISLRPKEVAVKLNLSMLLAPMKGKIESKLRSKLAEELG